MLDTFARVCETFPSLPFSVQRQIADFVNEEVADRNAPLHWNDYRRRVVDHFRKVGMVAASEITGIGKTTLYRWRKELKCQTQPTP